MYLQRWNLFLTLSRVQWSFFMDIWNLVQLDIVSFNLISIGLDIVKHGPLLASTILQKDYMCDIFNPNSYWRLGGGKRCQVVIVDPYLSWMLDPAKAKEMNFIQIEKAAA